MSRYAISLLCLALLGCTFDTSGAGPVAPGPGDGPDLVMADTLWTEATPQDTAAADLGVSDLPSSEAPPTDLPLPDSPVPDLSPCPHYSRKLSVVNGKVTGGPFNSFPLLVALSGSYLRPIGSGGKVAHPSGRDIFFSSDLTGSTKLDHEVEQYDAVTGGIVAWVRMPSLSSTTELYIHYGDCTITTSQENVTGVWKASYKGVWHLNETVADEATSGKHYDSTSNAIVCDQNANDDVSGVIAQGQDLDGDDSIGCGANKISNPTHHTITAWVNVDRSSGGNYFGVVVSVGTVDPWPGLALYIRRSDGAFGHFVSSWRLSSVNKVPSNQWAYLAIRGFRDPSSGYLGVSLNGSAFENIMTGNTTNLAVNSGTALNLGSYGVAVAHMTHGTLDEVRIADVVRSNNWISTEHANQSDPAGFYVVGPETP